MEKRIEQALWQLKQKCFLDAYFWEEPREIRTKDLWGALLDPEKPTVGE